MVRKRMGEKGREQTRKRVKTVTKLVDDEIATLQKSANELLEIAPVKSVLDLMVGTINNTANFIKKQAELTRERAR